MKNWMKYNADQNLCYIASKLLRFLGHFVLVVHYSIIGIFKFVFRCITFGDISFSKFLFFGYFRPSLALIYAFSPILFLILIVGLTKEAIDSNLQLSFWFSRNSDLIFLIILVSVLFGKRWIAPMLYRRSNEFYHMSGR